MKKNIACRFCKTSLKYTFVDLGMSPIANNYIKPGDEQKMEPFYPLHVYVCHKCFLVQLPSTVDRKIIFNDEYAYFSSYSDTWLEHAKQYVDMMVDHFKFETNNLVVELASNDGYLLQYFKEKGVPVLGIEPTANTAKVAIEKGIPTLVKFFGASTAKDLVKKGERADLIIGNNVLAHVPDLNDFVGGIKILLEPSGVVTIEFPHLMNLINHNEFDTIYHEHYSYFSYLTVEKIFAYHGLTLFNVEEIPTHGGSLRIYGKHTENKKLAITKRVRELCEREIKAGFNNIEMYASFQEKIKETKRQLLEFLIKAKREGKTIVAYGAPAKGNTLLNYCGIRTDFLDYTVDRIPDKQNHFLPGTHIPIFSLDKLTETNPDYVLILPWNLKEEVVKMEQMRKLKRQGTKFVIPIPEVRII